MLTMQRFHTLFFTDSENLDAYFRTLKSLTHITPVQMKAWTGDLGWQTWSAKAP
jgi:hypothetical protein